MNEFLNQINHARFNNHIYLLGNYERRITVYSQQVRATNLIFSLQKEKILTAKSKIAILGAGAAGLTVAANASLLGVKNISLFEKGTGILPLWKNCNSRWLHPNIFSWPEKGWSNDHTQLPILNWKSDLAANVAKNLSRQVKILSDHFEKKIRIKTHYNCEARILRETNSVDWGDTKSEPFDLIFICVGFGRDGKLNDENTCYWANDNICALKAKPDIYFLSGTGDGGIADLLRIRIRDFDLNRLKGWLALPEVEKLTERVQEIENEATRLNLKNNLQVVNDFLQTEYEKIKTPGLKRTIKEMWRTDTSIAFHAKSKSLYNYGSFPLNRFLLSRYMEAKDPNFKFKHGEIINLDELNNSGASSTSLSIKIKDLGPTPANVFISRHGPKSPLTEDGYDWIDKSQMAIDLKAKNTLDQTGKLPVFDLEEYNKLPVLTKLQKIIQKELIAVALIKNKTNGKFLFTERLKKEGRFDWGFPAKRIRTDRSYNVKEGIISECEQETGITPKPIKIIGQRIHPITGSYVEYWLCEYAKGTPVVKDKNELKTVKWATPEEIVKLAADLYPPLKDVLYGRNY